MYEIANNNDDLDKDESIIAINTKCPSPKFLNKNLSALCRPLEKYKEKDWISLWELQDVVIISFFFSITCV